MTDAPRSTGTRASAGSVLYPEAVSFPAAARVAIGDSQLRRNLTHATTTIRAKRAAVVAELEDWEELRAAGAAIKDDALSRLAGLLETLEERVTAAGGHVHWAGDAEEANRIVTQLVTATGAREVVKVKSMTTEEIALNGALEQAGLTVHETDLAELIVQLAHDRPSHILVPAIHKNRTQIRDLFRQEMPGRGTPVDPDLTDEPAALAGLARQHLRETFLRAKVAVLGANFAVAETGTLCVVESEGNGRMCLTLPDTLITVMGIEKVVPRWSDLGVFLQLLPRSSTGERMNPYTSMWTGLHDCDGVPDGPRQFHLVLLDNGRSAVLGDPDGRAALRCIRCSACLNVCPVYERVGGHAYGSVYPGPIGAVLTPQLTGMPGHGVGDSLPYASSLCGACLEACPVRIDIPTMLVHLRTRHVDGLRESGRLPRPEALGMRAAAWAMDGPRRWERVATLGRLGRGLARVEGGRLSRLPPPLRAWTSSRDAPVPPPETFRQWWDRTHVRGTRPTGRPS